MSQNNSEKLLSGLVKKTNFRYPAQFSGHWGANPSGAIGLGPKINDLLYRFVKGCKHVYRLGGLTQPVYEVSPQTTESLCMRAILVAEQFMRQNPEKKGRDFVLMDGTPWSDVVNSELYGYDILYICVFWKQDKPVIAIITGPRKWQKTEGTMCSHIVEQSMQFTIIQYDEDEEDIAQLYRLRNAIFSQTNFRLLKDFGTAIIQAVEATIDRENEYPVAAANWVDGVVWYVDRPHRHHHILQSREYQEAYAGQQRNEVQGFLTNHGNFVTRYRAMLMAVDNKMIVDTPTMSVMLTRCESKLFHQEDPKMGGIWRERDMDERGYLISVTPLFSEDLF